MGKWDFKRLNIEETYGKWKTTYFKEIESWMKSIIEKTSSMNIEKNI